jgi:predicted nucleic acid-binding protein
MELADTSAWTNRHKDPGVLADFTERLEAGEIAICPMVELELLWSTRDERSFYALRAQIGVLERLPINDLEWHRAAEVFGELAARGPLHHRKVKLPDLLVAAAAESASVPVCHYDGNFDLIAELTGQPVRAIAPLGSL